MFIATEHSFEVGTRFAFDLEVPGEDDPFRLFGEVRWAVTPEDMEGLKEPVPDMEPGMGIRFVFDDAAQQEALDARVRDMVEEAFGPVITSKLLTQWRL